VSSEGAECRMLKGTFMYKCVEVNAGEEASNHSCIGRDGEKLASILSNKPQSLSSNHGAHIKWPEILPNSIDNT
jgi:hypothetical protein